MKENSIEWLTGDKIATVTFTQQKYINRVLKLAEVDPDAVEIIEMPEGNHGYFVAHVRCDRVRIDTRAPISDEAREWKAKQLKRNLGK